MKSAVYIFVSSLMFGMESCVAACILGGVATVAQWRLRISINLHRAEADSTSAPTWWGISLELLT